MSFLSVCLRVLYVANIMLSVCLGGKAYGQMKDEQFQTLEEINEVCFIMK